MYKIKNEIFRYGVRAISNSFFFFKIAARGICKILRHFCWYARASAQGQAAAQSRWTSTKSICRLFFLIFSDFFPNLAYAEFVIFSDIFVDMRAQARSWQNGAKKRPRSAATPANNGSVRNGSKKNVSGPKRMCKRAVPERRPITVALKNVSQWSSLGSKCNYLVGFKRNLG